MSIVSLRYLVSHFRPCGGLYCHPFSNEGLDGTSETPTTSTISSALAYESIPHPLAIYYRLRIRCVIGRVKSFSLRHLCP